MEISALKSKDEEFKKLPRHMSLIENVFCFSHNEALLVLQKFQNNVDLLKVIDRVISLIEACDLSPEDKKELINLVNEERQIISYAIVSRSSVLAV